MFENIVLQKIALCDLPDEANIFSTRHAAALASTPDHDKQKFVQRMNQQFKPGGEVL